MPLAWHDQGTSTTRGLCTHTHQSARVSEFAFVVGFAELSARLARDGFNFSSQRSVGHYDRWRRTELATYPYQSSFSSYSFFASIRFKKVHSGGTLILHRAARGKPGESLEEVFGTEAFDPPSTGTLMWINEPELDPSPTRASLASLALVVYGISLSVAEEFGSIEIPYRRAPTKRYPNGSHAVFSLGTSKLAARLAPTRRRTSE